MDPTLLAVLIWVFVPPILWIGVAAILDKRKDKR